LHNPNEGFCNKSIMERGCDPWGRWRSWGVGQVFLGK
jgi:hypothetical protein